jgi:hypothetical protein
LHWGGRERALTGKDKENQPVHNQDGPENGHVEDGKPGAEKRNANGSGCPVPELEFRKTSDEGLEFLVSVGWEGADRTIFHFVIQGVVRRIEFRLEEGQEQVEKIDSQGIGD